MVTKKLGLLIIVILAASIAVTMNDVRIKVTPSSTTFYVFQDGVWLVGGVESNALYNGTKSISRGTTTLSSFPVGMQYKIIRNASYGKAIVTDTYLFDGISKDKELFPVYHTIQVLNGKGLTYQYTAGSLQYSGPNLKNVPSPQSFGRNMKITFQDGWKSNTLTKLTSGGSLKVKYAVTSNNQVFNVRMFDPWWSLGNSYTYEEQVPDAGYPDSGGRLTDGIAVNNWDCGGGLHTCHIGFQTPNPGQNYSVNTTIVMDLNTTITIDNIAINVWAWSGTNGFNMPHNVTVYGSSDKSAWTSMGLMNVPAATADSINMTSNYSSTSYRYLAFQILGHVDQWMFLDEIYVNGAANEAPQWSNNQSSTPAIYSPSTASTFNITWVNGTVNSLDTVLIEGNWSGTATNYTYDTKSTTTTYNNITKKFPTSTGAWLGGAGLNYDGDNATGAYNYTPFGGGQFPFYRVYGVSNYTITQNNSELIDLNFRVGVNCTATTYMSGDISARCWNNTAWTDIGATGTWNENKFNGSATKSVPSSCWNSTGESKLMVQYLEDDIQANCWWWVWEENVTIYANSTNVTIGPSNATINYSSILPAGHWYWKSYANDSSGSWNVTPSWFFDIGQLPNPLTLVLNNSGNMS